MKREVSYIFLYMLQSPHFLMLELGTEDYQLIATAVASLPAN